MIFSSPPRYVYARMRRSASNTFPSLKFGLLSVVGNAGRAGAWAKLAGTASSDNNGTARPITIDPQSARVKVFVRKGISIRLILSSARREDRRSIAPVRRDPHKLG